MLLAYSVCSFTLIGVSVQLQAIDVGSLLIDPLDIQIHIPKEKKLNIKLPEDANIPQVTGKLPEIDKTNVKEAAPVAPEANDSNPEVNSKKPKILMQQEPAMMVKSMTSPKAITEIPGHLSWRKYLGKNCWERHGADNMSPEPYSKSLSLTNCQGACEEDESCEGIVIKRGKESLGPCFMRRNIQLSRCKDNTPYDLYLKQTGSTATTEEDPKASVKSKSRITFDHHTRAQ